jgi:hypothetical protein
VLLLLLVPPLFSGSQKRAERIFCRSNLAQIGKLMFVYANDYEGALPRAVGPTTLWGQTPNWMGNSRYQAYSLGVDNSGGMASISASLYLLVKYMGAPPRLFVCKADKGTTEFRIDELAVALPARFELADAWDFGPSMEAWKHNSYAYQIPYEPNALTLSRDPNMAVLADRNPWIRSPAPDPANYLRFTPDMPPWNGSTAEAHVGNAITHQNDGQNVFFLSGSAAFETRAFCGTEDPRGSSIYSEPFFDNIYTVSTALVSGNPLGYVPEATWEFQPTNALDSVLVHDPNVFSPDPPPPRRR